MAIDKQTTLQNQRGVTIAELLIYLAVSSVLMSGMMVAIQAQSSGYNQQAQISDTQQNLRTGLNLMSNELRYASFDPTGQKSAGFTAANPTDMTFSRLIDTTADGIFTTADELQTISYHLCLNSSNALCRTSDSGAETPIIENIDQFRFEYLMKDQSWISVGAVDSDGNGDFSGSGDIDPRDIRAIKIVVLGKTDIGGIESNRPIIPPLDSVNLTWTAPAGDSSGRRLMSTTVQCRNQTG